MLARGPSFGMTSSCDLDISLNPKHDSRRAVSWESSMLAGFDEPITLYLRTRQSQAAAKLGSHRLS